MPKEGWAKDGSKVYRGDKKMLSSVKMTRILAVTEENVASSMPISGSRKSTKEVKQLKRTGRMWLQKRRKKR